MSASLAADQMAAGSLPLIDQPDEPRRRRKALAFLVLLFGLLALIVTIASYLLFRQPINPLPPVPVSQLPTYSTSIYGMTRPVGVAVSASGDRIYVTQGGAATEGVVLDARGEVVGRMVPPADSGTDHQPVYAAVDPITSEVYVSDRMAGTIYVFDRDGGYRREFVPDGMAGWQPLGLSFDRSGHLFVTDLALGQVLEFDRDGAVVRAIGATRTLNFPNGVSISSDGLVFVTDSNNGRLFAYADDTIIAQVGRGAGEGNLGLPRGLAVDASGRIFIVDTTAQRVFVYAVPEGIVIPGRAIDFAGWFGGRTFIGDPAVHDRGQSTVDFTSARLDYIGSFGVQGIADGRFQFPNSVAVDGRGRVYVADTFNDRIQIWSY